MGVEICLTEREREMSSPSEWRDWSSLTEPLLMDILRRLDTLQDFFAFRHVCPSWRAAAAPSPESLSCQHPLLLLVGLSYYDIVQRRLYAASGGGAASMLASLSAPARKPIAGYAFGYLVGATISHANSASLVFQSIFTEVPTGLPESLQLPPITGAGGFDHVLLSSQPSSTDCLILLYSKSRESTAVQYLRIGDPHWTVVRRPERRISDMIFFKKKLYALSSDSRLLAVHLNDGQLSHELLGGGMDDQLIPDVEKYEEMRLAVSEGQLLAICKSNFTWIGIKFHVFCWDFERRGWRRKGDLGGRALFLGPQGFAGSFTASDLMGIKGDSIYYLGYENDRWYKFSLRDRSLIVVSLPRPLLQLGEDRRENGAFMSPLWVLPSIC